MNRMHSSLGIVLASLLAACGGGDKKLQLGGDCSLNSDCNDPLVCKFSACHQACTQTRDCPTGERCIQVDNAGICQLVAETACGSTSPQCKTPLVCASDKICRNTCTAGGDCLKGQDCVASVCIDVAESTRLLDGGAEVPPIGGDAAASSGDTARSSVDTGANRADLAGGTDLPEGRADAGSVDAPASAPDATSGGADATSPSADVVSRIDLAADSADTGRSCPGSCGNLKDGAFSRV